MATKAVHSNGQAEGKACEVLAQVIAGPITAAQLGVPEGTVVDARHVHPARANDIVSPAEAAAIRAEMLKG